MTNDEIVKKEVELAALQKAKAERIQEDIDALAKEQASIDQKKFEMAKQRENTQLVDSITNNVMEKLNKGQKVGIDTTGNASKEPKNKLAGFRNAYLKNHGYKHMNYGSEEWQVGSGKTYNFADSDTGCDNDVSDWTPAEVFSDMIWSAFYCKGYLAGRVTVRGVDFARGKGDTVSIRTRGKRTAQGPLNPCECLSCVSSSFSKVSLTLDAYGDLAEVCEIDLQLAGDVIKDGIIEDMASGLAEQVDLEIYSQLATSGAAHSHLSACCSGPSLDGCCSQVVDLYNQLVLAEADMRTAGYKPDYVILGPALAAYFKFKEAVSQQGLQISFSGNELSKIGSMSVIEFPCATVCSTVTDTVVAIVLDSSKAIGEGWGMKPKLEQDRNIDCDSTTIAMHMYCAVDELDVGAIRLIKTPVSC